MNFLDFLTSLVPLSFVVVVGFGVVYGLVSIFRGGGKAKETVDAPARPVQPDYDFDDPFYDALDVSYDAPPEPRRKSRPRMGAGKKYSARDR
jgi:hypothetical protein